MCKSLKFFEITSIKRTKIYSIEKNSSVYELKFYFEVKRPERETDDSNPVPNIRMSGAMSQLSHTLSWHKSGKLYCFLQG